MVVLWFAQAARGAQCPSLLPDSWYRFLTWQALGTRSCWVRVSIRLPGGTIDACSDSFASFRAVLPRVTTGTRRLHDRESHTVRVALDPKCTCGRTTSSTHGRVRVIVCLPWWADVAYLDCWVKTFAHPCARSTPSAIFFAEHVGCEVAAYDKRSCTSASSSTVAVADQCALADAVYVQWTSRSQARSL